MDSDSVSFKKQKSLSLISKNIIRIPTKIRIIEIVVEVHILIILCYLYKNTLTHCYFPIPNIDEKVLTKNSTENSAFDVWTNILWVVAIVGLFIYSMIKTIHVIVILVKSYKNRKNELIEQGILTD